ncbi:MAG TPA: hypothetical protein VKD90_16570 [Gemmataceae bacterium]|nr:hypothetical protein [Gemmataceae bacterium]
MRQRPTLLLGVCFILGCLILGLFNSAPSAGQAPPRPPEAARPGKYQVAASNMGPSTSVVVLCDTETGRMWRSDNGGDWGEIASPVFKKGK